MRLFIALPVPADAQKALISAQAALKRSGVRGRFSPPENLHMTLVFLGETPDPAPVIKAMRLVRVPRASLTFNRLTMFGDVTVALMRPTAALTRYAKALRASLDEAGIAYDPKPFRPHITLCRKTALPAAEFPLSASERPLRALRVPVREVRLFLSDLTGQTSRYTLLAVSKSG